MSLGRAALKQRMFVRECALCIPGTWIDNYTNWRNFVFAMKSAMPDAEGLKITCEVASRAPRFPTGHGTTELWDSASPNGELTAGSIIYWAQTLNPVGFASICALCESSFPIKYP